MQTEKEVKSIALIRKIEWTRTTEQKTEHKIVKKKENKIIIEH